MLVVSFMMSGSELQILQLSLGEVTLRHNLWLETIPGSGVALHLVEAWKVGRGTRFPCNLHTLSATRFLFYVFSASGT